MNATNLEKTDLPKSKHGPRKAAAKRLMALLKR